MPLTRERTKAIYIRLLDEYELQAAEHLHLSPPAGTIAVGGAHMDSFFRMEALMGATRYLRLKKGNSLSEALQAGNEASAYAVRRWNESRPKEYQVHRWEKTAEGYLRHQLYRK